MTQPATPKISEVPATMSTTASPVTRDLPGDRDGRITVADGVVLPRPQVIRIERP